MHQERRLPGPRERHRPPSTRTSRPSRESFGCHGERVERTRGRPGRARPRARGRRARGPAPRRSIPRRLTPRQTLSRDPRRAAKTPDEQAFRAETSMSSTSMQRSFFFPRLPVPCAEEMSGQRRTPQVALLAAALLRALASAAAAVASPADQARGGGVRARPARPAGRRCAPARVGAADDPQTLLVIGTRRRARRSRATASSPRTASRPTAPSSSSSAGASRSGGSGFHPLVRAEAPARHVRVLRGARRGSRR